MSHRKGIWIMLGIGLAVIILLYCLTALRRGMNLSELENSEGVYQTLPADTQTEDPLQYITEDFTVEEEFHTNLPIVILTIEGELAQYKSFESNNDIEVIDENVEPYSNGTIRILDSGNEYNCLTDTPVYTSNMKIKRRGNNSFTYDKPQYLMKMIEADGMANHTEILGMGEGNSWILNGSMADKSMIRNYLSFRIASEVGGSAMAPDSRYCEVILEKDGHYEYQGVYLLMETVDRGENRINIDAYNEGDVCTSYIVRRDRYTSLDTMLDTYGRLNGFSPEWIGVKYPSINQMTEQAKSYIEKDFSKMEQVIYSTDASVFKAYDKYIDINSFVDYFLINEYFGNYDAGEHSTYMYKKSGGALYIGPVWDFDQAMNNYYQDEMDPYTLAFQTKPLFDRLANDKRFIDCLKERYAVLRKDVLSEEHVFAVMDETVAYLRSARQREWYRWAADYMDGSFTNPHNYYLQDYVQDDVTVSRFNDQYDQELYIIRTYLHKHGRVIQNELTKLYDLAEFNTSLKNENELFLLIIMVLFMVPSILINRKA